MILHFLYVKKIHPIIMTVVNRKFIESLKILLTNIEDPYERLSFRRTLDDAIKFDDKEKIKKIFSMLAQYISPDKHEIREPTYKSKPTMQTACLDFLFYLCNDLVNLPNLKEYFASAELCGFPDASGWNKTQNKTNIKRTSKSINTFVKKDMILVSADCQSGKTKFSVCVGLKAILEKRTPIFIVRNQTADANKLENDILLILESFREFLKKNLIEDSLDITIYRGNKLEKNIVDETLKRKRLSIIICLANETQLSEPLLSCVKNNPSTYDIIIDEIDYIDCGDSAVSELLKIYKKNAYQPFGVTATPIDVILAEKDLKSVNNIRLKRPADYRGIIDYQFKLLEIDPNVSAINIKATYNEIIENDKNLKPFLDNFSKSKPDFAWVIKKYIPNICLIKNTCLNENQEALYDGIVKDYTESIVCILYNGKGIKMWYKNIAETFKIKNTTVHPNVYAKIDIPDALQHLKDNGGVKRFPRICVLACYLGSRCISYVSRDYEYHLTDMYYVPADNTPIPEIIQSACRLSGRNKGKSHLHLHCTKKTADALYKGFHLTTELITRAIAEPLTKDDDELSFAESIKSVKINKTKFPVGRRFTGKIKIKKNEFNLVKGEDGGFDLKKYKYEIEEIKEDIEEIEEKKEDIDDISGILIKRPGNDGKNLNDYLRIVEYLSKMKGKWVMLKTIRRIFSDNKYNINLHVKSDIYCSQGLMYRQINGKNGSIEYCYV